MNNKNKKICILTLQGNYNFGNRLQNIALNYYLSSRNNKIITYCKNSNGIKAWFKPIYAMIYNKFNVFKKDNSTLILRETRFNKYCKKHLCYKNMKSFENYLCFVGSDQVWAPNTIEETDIYLLSNISCKKKISYAASIAANQLPDYLKDKYKKNIENFDFVSVREECGKQLLLALGLKNVECVLDPTLLLSRTEWEKFEEKVPLPNETYALKYFLSKENKDYSKKIEDFCDDKQWKLIDLTDSSCKEWYKINPGEFLYLLKNASCFFTDSFHGTIFSWIYQVPFFIYSRNSKTDMSSRIFDLLKILNLENRLNMDINDENLQVNWIISSDFNDRLLISKEFINNCLL